MKKYELIYLISSDQDAPKIQEKVVSFIVENSGTIDSEKIDPAPRELGFEIKGHHSAYLSSIIFSIESLESSGFKKFIIENSEIIRYILISKPKGRKKNRPIEKIEEKSSVKINLKDIDKKIEEMLND